VVVESRFLESTLAVEEGDTCFRMVLPATSIAVIKIAM
jgi:hypothetical protein